MKVLVTGGGTAGHVTPLLAVVDELRHLDPQARIRYVGKFGDKFDSFVEDNNNIERRYKILAGKWRRYHGVSVWSHFLDIKTILFNIRDALFFLLGFLQSLYLLLLWRPNVVFVKGGFVGLPVGVAAGVLRIPIVTHDSDSLPGLTNRLLARFASAQAVGLPSENYNRFYNLSKVEYTGVPVRAEYFESTDLLAKKGRDKLGLTTKEKVVLVVGGSLGAIRLNNAIFNNLSLILTGKEVRLLWVTGDRQFKEISDRVSGLEESQKRQILLFPIVNNLEEFVAVADVVVSRAGATMIAELAAASKPTILVPNPILTDGHQQKNAIALGSVKAAVVITEEELTADTKSLGAMIANLLADKEKCLELGEKIHSIANPKAAEKIANILIKVSRL